MSDLFPQHELSEITWVCLRLFYSTCQLFHRPYKGHHFTPFKTESRLTPCNDNCVSNNIDGHHVAIPSIDGHSFYFSLLESLELI